MRGLVFGDSFLKSAKNLNATLKLKLKFCLDILQKEPFDNRLHTKSLKGSLSGFYSFRLGGNYRVIFKIKLEEIFLIDIGHRKDVYK